MSDTDANPELCVSDTVFDKRHEDGKRDSDGSYSDSDDDKLHSMYSVIKPGHIPGKYKLGAEKENQEDREKTEDTSSLDDGGLGNTNDDRITEKIADAEDHDQETTGDGSGKSMLDTNFFGKSMVVIEKDDLEECSLEQISRPSLPPKPVKDPSSSPNQRPKPAPRRKRMQNLSTVECAEEEITSKPSPRLERRHPSSTTEQVSNENSDGKETRRTGDTIETTEKEAEDTEPDNLEDTVDFGHAEEGKPVLEPKPEETDDKFESMDTFIIHEQSARSSNHGEEQAKEDRKAVTNEDIHIELQILDSDGSGAGEQSNNGGQSGAGGKTEKSDSDEEQADRFDNNFQDSSSLEDSSDDSTDDDYRTPRNMSTDEDEAGKKDIPEGHEVKVQEIEKAEESSELRANDTFRITLSSRFGESFEVIETGTFCKGYESLSSTVSSGDLPKSSEFDHEEENVLCKRKSVKDMTKLFEGKSAGISTNIEKHKHNASDSSFDILLYTDEPSAYSSDHTMNVNEEMKTEPVQHTNEKAETKIEVEDTEEDFAQFSFDVTDGKTSPSMVVLKTEENTVPENNFVKKETPEIETVKTETADADVAATVDVPPPVGPRSMQVLESLKSLTVEYNKPPHTPPKSIPSEKVKYEEQYGTTSYMIPGARTNAENSNTLEWNTGRMNYMPYGQQTPRLEETPYMGTERGTTEQGNQNQYPFYSQQQPFFSPNPQQQQYPINQPYFYYDQSGNPQYPYAYYLNPGMHYQDGQFYQQPFFCTPQKAQFYNPPTSTQPESQQYEMFEELQQSLQIVSKETPPRDQHVEKEHALQSTAYSQRPARDLQAEGVQERHITAYSQKPPVTESGDPLDDGYVEIGVVDTSVSKRRKSEQTLEKQHPPPFKYRRTQLDVSKVKKPTPMEKPKPPNKPGLQREERRQKTAAAGEAKETAAKEEHYLLFKGISPDTRAENLSNFVEIMTNSEVDHRQIIFNHSRDSALVVAITKPELDKGRKRIKEKGLDNFFPELLEVEPPTCIAVSCEEEIKNSEGLEYYFESKRAGGGEVKGHPYESEDGSCIVIEFTDAATVKRVCERPTPHKYDQKTLRVSPYYISKDSAIWDSELHVVRLPKPVVVTLETNRKRFLEKWCGKELLSKLKENYCETIFVEDGLKVECTLTPKIKNFKTLAKTWESTARNMVKVFIDENVAEDTVDVSGEKVDKVWSELQEFIHGNIEDSDRLVFSLNAVSFRVYLVGCKDAVERQHRNISSKQDEIRRRLRITSETIKREPLQIRLLNSMGVLKTANEDLKIKFKDDTIIATGQPEDVKLFLLNICATVDSFSKVVLKHRFSKEFVGFIESKLSTELNYIIRKQGHTAEWEISPREVTFCVFLKQEDDFDCDEDDVYSRIDDSRAERAKDIQKLFENALFEVNKNIEDDVVDVFESQEWISKIQQIAEEFESSAELEFKQFEKQLLVYGLEKEAKTVYTMVLEFIDENSIKRETIKVGTMQLQFVERFKGECVSDIEKKLEGGRVKLFIEDGKVTISGNKAGIQQAKLELKTLLDSVICTKHTIQKVAVNEVFRDQRDQGRISIVERDTKCLIQVQGEDEVTEDHNFMAGLDSGDEENFGDVQAAGSAEVAGYVDGFEVVSQKPAKKKSFQAQNGVKITLIKGEIGKQSGDIIVVTTSPNLNLQSGAACKSVLKESGPKLQEECKRLYPNVIESGAIAAVPATGSLECQHVYFTTLPTLTPEVDPIQIVQKIMKDSLEMASKHNKRSVIYCALGTGQLKYPADVVAMVMYQSVIDFDQKQPKTTLKDVQFVLYPKDYSTVKAFEEEEMLRVDGDGQRNTIELQRGSLKMELSVENIAQQKVDAILCSTAPNMDLSRSGACQALLRSGGQSLQDECKSKYNNTLDEGQVVEIGGGKLPCKFVFLTVIPSFSQDAVPKLKKVIETFLGTAKSKNLTSVALPALGTGYLKYPHEEVCRCMFETVSDWAMKNNTSSLKTVRFIMHAKDHVVIQRFKSYIANVQGRGTRQRRSSSDKVPSQTQQKPIFIKDSFTKRAHTTVFNAHAKGVQVGDIKLSVLSDDILTQNCDAIVSSAGKDFEFIGAVAHELKKRCAGLEQECKSQKNQYTFHKEGVVITDSFGLAAKSIVHVQFADSIREWHRKILKCLEVANSHNLHSVAFPILGTGKGFTTFSPDAMAECFFDAVSDFVCQHKKHALNDVRLIVYKGQPLMFEPIMEKLHKKVREAIEEKSDTSWTTAISKKAKKLKKFAKDLFLSDSARMTPEEKKMYCVKRSSIELVIYSDDQSNIDTCKKELDAQLEKAYTRKKIENYKEIITSLTAEESEELDTVALANINIDSNAGIITVDGPTKQVADVVHHLQSALLRIERQRHSKAAAEELYKIAQWHYEEVTQTEFKPVPYEKHLNYKIEQAYKNQEKIFEFQDNDGEIFVIDFQNNIEYPKSNKDDSLRVIRKDILKAAQSKLPDTWIEMKDNENIKVVTLTTSDKEYTDLETRFMSEVKTGSFSQRYTFNVNNLKVNKIERIQNKTLYHQYMAKKKQVTEQKPNLPANMPIERELWHGTKFDAVTSITMHGFNRSYSGNANGEPWYGQGVYFAADASYSARGWLSGAGAGSKGYMFLVKTITGHFVKGQKGMRYLPAVNASKDGTILYDCAVDNEANPMEFVIFNDTQAYPAYIVTFTT